MQTGTTATLLNRRKAALPAGAAAPDPVFPDQVDGSDLWDTDGWHCADTTAGVAVMNAGHRPPVRRSGHIRAGKALCPCRLARMTRALTGLHTTR
jgi:4-aminobutyrate aminotransferase-like enzyme